MIIQYNISKIEKVDIKVRTPEHYLLLVISHMLRAIYWDLCWYGQRKYMRPFCWYMVQQWYYLHAKEEKRTSTIKILYFKSINNSMSWKAIRIFKPSWQRQEWIKTFAAVKGHGKCMVRFLFTFRKPVGNVECILLLWPKILEIFNLKDERLQVHSTVSSTHFG